AGDLVGPTGGFHGLQHRAFLLVDLDEHLPDLLHEQGDVVVEGDDTDDLGAARVSGVEAVQHHLQHGRQRIETRLDVADGAVPLPVGVGLSAASAGRVGGD